MLNNILQRIDREETVSISLRNLYGQYGYSKYKMSKFEEYDLYAQNKDFLLSDNIITFTDLNGKLMALKPDVTLSVIKGTKELQNMVRKVYYNENVYRPSANNSCFKEIMQVGLECIGAIDDLNVTEVVILAAESLKIISSHSILNISDQDVIVSLFEQYNIPPQVQSRLIRLISEKNCDEIGRYCDQIGISAEFTNLLNTIIRIDGNPRTVMQKLSALKITGETAGRLFRLCSCLSASHLDDWINIDFSVIADTNYYNGIIFNGYVEGIPSKVLSGGQYDHLMSKQGKKMKAVGFAVYLDTLEYLSGYRDDPDFDVLVTYDETADPAAVLGYAAQRREEGCRVSVQRYAPDNADFREHIRFTEKGRV